MIALQAKSSAAILFNIWLSSLKLIKLDKTVNPTKTLELSLNKLNSTEIFFLRQSFKGDGII